MEERLARRRQDGSPLFDVLLLDFLDFELRPVDWLDFETRLVRICLAAVYYIASVRSEGVEVLLDGRLVPLQVAAILAVDDVFRFALHARLIPRIEFGR